MPITLSVAPQQLVTLTRNSAHAQDAADVLAASAVPSCVSFTDFDITACIAQGIYTALWKPTHWIVSGVARLQDYFIFYSISDSSYRTAIIQEGWELVRDISNLLFIFALIYIAVATILGSRVAGKNPKSLIITVLLMALLINFSLFFSKIIVDAGNTLAWVFYSQIQVVDGNNAANANDIKPVGLALIDISDPQNIMRAQATSPIRATANDASTFLLTTIISTIFNIVLIITFLKITIFFVVRVIGIYISMMFSPVAFASKALPNTASVLKDMSFKNWMNGLIKLSLMAPIYLFFLYLIARFLEIGIGVAPLGSITDSLMATVMPSLVKLAIMLGFIKMAEETTKTMAGRFADGVGKITGAVVGLAGGLALGGVAVAGAKAASLGKAAAQKTGVASRVQSGLDSNNRVVRAASRIALRTGNKLQTSSFDARNTKVGSFLQKQASKQAGGSVNFNSAPLSRLGMSTKQTKGGAEAAIKRSKEKVKQRAESLTLQGDQKKVYDARAKAYNADLQVKQGRRDLYESEFERINKEFISQRGSGMSEAEKKLFRDRLIERGEYVDASGQVQVLDTKNKGKKVKFNAQEEELREYRQNFIGSNLDQIMADRAQSMGVSPDSFTKEERDRVKQQILTTGKYDIVEKQANGTNKTVNKQITEDKTLQGRVGAEDKMLLADELNEQRVERYIKGRQAERDATGIRGGANWAARAAGRRGGFEGEDRALYELSDKYSKQRKKREKINRYQADMDSVQGEITDLVTGRLQEAAAAIRATNPTGAQEIEAQAAELANIGSELAAMPGRQRAAKLREVETTLEQYSGADQSGYRAKVNRLNTLNELNQKLEQASKRPTTTEAKEAIEEAYRTLRPNRSYLDNPTNRQSTISQLMSELEQRRTQAAAEASTARGAAEQSRNIMSDIKLGLRDYDNAKKKKEDLLSGGDDSKKKKKKKSDDDTKDDDEKNSDS